ncbi:MAG TPA: DNA polymerase III subunit delta, partial [bacterium]
LGDGPRDFTFQRFDAAELLKNAGAEVMAGRIDAFQTACEAMPLLGDQRVVRLDRVEAVKVPDRASQTLQRALEAVKLCRVAWEGKPIWLAEADVERGEAIQESRPLMAWVDQVQPQSAGSPVLFLRGIAGSAFVLSRRGKRSEVPLAEFIRNTVKGKFVLPEEAEAGEDAAPAVGAGRLHQLLESLLANPPDGLTLILTANVTRETDLSKALVAALKEQKAPLEKFVTYDDYNPVDWVMNESQNRALRLTRPLAAALIERVGNDLGKLSQEMNRLALLFPASKSPTEDELLAAVHGGGQFNVFQISERLGHKDLEGALRALQQFLEDSPNEHPVLVGLLARHFRQLALVHDLIRGGVSEREMASRLKLHEFIAKKVVGQARRFKPRELANIRQAIAQIDTAAKRHGHLTDVLFKDFVDQVCRGGYERGFAPLP